MTATGRKKLDELYHPVVDRSEFYTMSDLLKPPVLFTPSEDIDKVIFAYGRQDIFCTDRNNERLPEKSIIHP